MSIGVNVNGSGDPGSLGARLSLNVLKWAKIFRCRRVDLFQTIYGAEHRLPTQADGTVALSSTERRDLQPARTCDLRAASTLPFNTPTRPQLLLNSAVLDRLGALAIYLRSEER